MAKKIKDSEGFIVGWNKDREDKRCSDKITFFYRYKNIIKPIPAKPWDIGHHLVKAIKKIEKEEAKDSNKIKEIIKKELADKYIKDLKQKEIFLNEAIYFKQWANYIAGLVLTQEGKKIFTQADIKRILKERLIPNYYGKKGFMVGSLLIADVEKNSSWHNEYPSLKKVDRGKYKFVGFNKK